MRVGTSVAGEGWKEPMLVQIVRREIATQHIHSYGVVQYRKHLGKDSSGCHPQEADLNG